MFSPSSPIFRHRVIRLFDFGFDQNVLACKTLVTLAISRREQAIAKRQ